MLGLRIIAPSQRARPCRSWLGTFDTQRSHALSAEALLEVEHATYLRHRTATRTAPPPKAHTGPVAGSRCDICSIFFKPVDHANSPPPRDHGDRRYCADAGGTGRACGGRGQCWTRRHRLLANGGGVRRRGPGCRGRGLGHRHPVGTLSCVRTPHLQPARVGLGAASVCQPTLPTAARPQPPLGALFGLTCFFLRSPSLLRRLTMGGMRTASATPTPTRRRGAGPARSSRSVRTPPPRGCVTPGPRAVRC